MSDAVTQRPTGPIAAGVDILLATFNGARYLGEQLASIEAQTYEDWHLIARDDGSDDRTPGVLADFRARHPERVTVLADRGGRLGVVQNFSRLMGASRAPYVALCDQDDVWLPDKLSLTVSKIHRLQATEGPAAPLLVFTDLTVVDEHLRVVHPSMWRYQRLRPDKCNDLDWLFSRNVVTGCSMLISRALVEAAAPLPRTAVVPDAWIALVGAAVGRNDYLPDSTVLYRQHSENLMGARRTRRFDLAGRAQRTYRRITRPAEHEDRRRTDRSQAEELLRRHSSGLPGRTRRFLEDSGSRSVASRAVRRLRRAGHDLGRSGPGG